MISYGVMDGTRFDAPDYETAQRIATRNGLTLSGMTYGNTAIAPIPEQLPVLFYGEGFQLTPSGSPSSAISGGLTLDGDVLLGVLGDSEGVNLVRTLLQYASNPVAGVVRIGAEVWNRIPSWVKWGLLAGAVLLGVGLVFGMAFLLRIGPRLMSLLGLVGGSGSGGSVGSSDGGPGAAMHGGVTKSWRVGAGTMMVRYADGWMGAEKKDGSWKMWKPKKPIVIFATGSSDIRDTLRAYHAATRQIRKVAKAATAIERRSTKRRLALA